MPQFFGAGIFQKTAKNRIAILEMKRTNNDSSIGLAVSVLKFEHHVKTFGMWNPLTSIPKNRGLKAY